MALATGVLVAATASVQARGTALPGPATQCEQAIRSAAQVSAIPTELMSAIALVESGRPDAASGAVHPWPWTINAEGKGFFFNSKLEAIEAVRTLQAQGVRSIDVGCMQVNLMHHPNAFATLDEAFEPAPNARYAGRFLSELSRRSANWLTAAGLYHSATPDLAADYIKRVAAVLQGSQVRSFAAARAAQPDAPARVAAPVVGRDGTILPSMRLTAAGLVKEHTRAAYLIPVGTGPVQVGRLTFLPTKPTRRGS